MSYVELGDMTHILQYVSMTITVNYHGNITRNFSNYIFASLYIFNDLEVAKKLYLIIM